MPYWADPLDTVRLRLPAEWVYDQYSSSLTTLWFDNWQVPEQHLVLAITPHTVDTRAGDEEWLGVMGRQVDGSGDARWLEVRSSAGWAVLQSGLPADGSYRGRALVRCAGLDVRIGFFRFTSEAAALAVVRPLVASLEIPACMYGGGVPDYTGVLETINRAGRAIAAGADDAPALLAETKEGLIVGWHHSLITPGRAPEIPAALYLAGILMKLGGWASDLLVLRDADLLVRRASRTLEEKGGVLTGAARARIGRDVAEAFDQVQSAQWRVLDPDGAVTDTERPDLLVQRRGGQLAAKAGQSLDVAALALCCEFSRAASEDLLWALWTVGRVVSVRDDPEPSDGDTRYAHHLMASLLPALFAEFDAGQLLHRESELRRTSELLLACCRFVGESDAPARQALTRAIIGRVRALTLFADGPALAHSRELLDEAERLLRQTDDVELATLAAAMRDHVQHLQSLTEGADGDG